MDSPGSGLGPLAGCCECGDEPSGSGASELVYDIRIWVLVASSLSIHIMEGNGLCL
jgi:hypothetical protein